MSEHSPGNWSVVNRMSCGEGWAVVSDHDFPGRPPTVHKRFMAQYCTIEDARLISAAPEMLEALEAAIECGIIPKSSAREGGANRHVRQAHVADMIRSAIAKAKGETE